METEQQVKKHNPFIRNDAVIYIRMSTNYQVQADSNSSEMQRKACETLCQSKGLPIKKIIEQVKSGRKYRKDLVDVIQKEMRPGNSIVVYSISRFARKQLHAHQLLEILRKKKCRLLSVTENMDTSVDDANLGLFAWLAELESRQTSTRVKSSLHAKRERGEHIGSMPYGFQYVDGKGSPLERNPEEMEVLERMRNWFNNDKMTYLQIARKLNNEGILSPKTKQLGGWIDKTVKKLITRDDSSILCRGKRSWYIAQGELSESSDDDDDHTQITQEPALILPPQTPETQPKQIQLPNEVEKEEIQSTIPEPIQETPNYEKKPLSILKILLLKRKDEFSLTEEEIRSFTKEEIVEILSLT
jgi:DNA invertase Pin-like site-specific DNA recombinase